MAIIFGVMLFFLITVGMVRFMYPLTIAIFNDLAVTSGSEGWAYFVTAIFIIVAFVIFITLLTWLLELYKDLVNY
jgi:hypothetical protein